MEETIPNENISHSDNQSALVSDQQGKLRQCVEAARDKKAQDLIVLDVRKISSFTDYFVICHGESHRQVGAVARHVEEKMKEVGYKPLGIEGYGEEQWILMDFGDIVVHVFLKSIRDFYDLERLWADAPLIAVDE